jgi:hypothetical protein
MLADKPHADTTVAGIIPMNLRETGHENNFVLAIYFKDITVFTGNNAYLSHLQL